MTRQAIVHFFILASMDFPLFFPKKVSLEPPRALIPVELPGCNNTRIIAASADRNIRAIIVTLSPIYKLYKASFFVGTNKFINSNISV